MPSSWTLCWTLPVRLASPFPHTFMVWALETHSALGLLRQTPLKSPSIPNYPGPFAVNLYLMDRNPNKTLLSLIWIPFQRKCTLHFSRSPVRSKEAVVEHSFIQAWPSNNDHSDRSSPKLKYGTPTKATIKAAFFHSLRSRSKSQWFVSRTRAWGRPRGWKTTRQCLKRGQEPDSHRLGSCV